MAYWDVQADFLELGHDISLLGDTLVETSAKLHAKIADARRDFLHKLSTRLVNENQVIAIESWLCQPMGNA